MTSSISDIGEGILHYSGNERSELDQLRGYSRFLNVLWLPCSLGELTPKQILLTNRFREWMFRTDGQFSHADFARRTFKQILSAMRPASVVELGCGKRPLLPDAPTEYAGFDIDAEAVTECRSLGLNVMLNRELYNNPHVISSIDVIYGVFMFHFHVDKNIWKILSAALSENGFMIFNGIVDNGFHYSKKLADISQFGLVMNVIKDKSFSTREFMFVICKPNDRIDQKIGLIRGALQ